MMMDDMSNYKTSWNPVVTSKLGIPPSDVIYSYCWKDRSKRPFGIEQFKLGWNAGIRRQSIILDCIYKNPGAHRTRWQAGYKEYVKHRIAAWNKLVAGKSVVRITSADGPNFAVAKGRPVIQHETDYDGSIYLDCGWWSFRFVELVCELCQNADAVDGGVLCEVCAKINT